ncbi:MAG: hypothetical protein HQ592_05040 [Planctomycetes bacterium]|jgi:hypothetical protein|nr:hypothetical protein [Planctomycetota bacterium]
MKRNEAQARMAEVQRIMERTTLYTLLPGAPAVIGGTIVLVGCIVSYALIRSVDFARVLDLSLETQIGFCIMWAAIGIVAIAQEILLMARAARIQGLSPTARPARFAAFSLTPSVAVAAVLTAKFLLDCTIVYIVPVWMMCYGTGVYAAGLFSVRLPRLIGLAFIIMGAAGLVFFPDKGLILAALSFGLLHIIFGLVILQRSRQTAEQ